MDTTKAITHVSLCAGYGGIDLGLKRAIPNLRTVAFAEIEAFACANLVAKMEARLLDPAPIWTNVKTFPWASFYGKVDILSGGYPCQPFSAAGKRLGKDDPRHLWPWIADGIRAMQPGLCFFENVEGHISLGLREVIGELEAIGYRTTWGLFSAAEVGAPHQRKRVFILAYCNEQGPQGLGRLVAQLAFSEKRTRQSGQAGICSSVGVVADSANRGRRENWMSGELRPSMLEQSSEHCGDSKQSEAQQVWPSRPGQPQHEWEPPRVVGDAEGKRSAALGAKYARLGWELCASSASDQAMGDTDHGGQPSCIDAGSGAKAIGRGKSDIEQAESGQTEPAMGGDAHGPAHRLDDAELYVTSDNRTDELRLLGNGVVPATAERAFRILSSRLLL
jgi:DNA (cytosine-5)-methyltransferase 1